MSGFSGLAVNVEQLHLGSQDHPFFDGLAGAPCLRSKCVITDSSV
jgi:hypothetical protein